MVLVRSVYRHSYDEMVMEWCGTAIRFTWFTYFLLILMILMWISVWISMEKMWITRETMFHIESSKKL